MSLLMWIIMGGIVGWLASIIMKTNEQMGIFYNIIAGIIGSLLGFWIVNQFLDLGVEENLFNIPGILSALVGSIILISIVRFFHRKLS